MWSHNADDSESFDSDVLGLKFTGWWPDGAPPLSAIEHLRLCWPEQSALFDFFVDPIPDDDGRDHQLTVNVRILDYPSPWLSVVECSLRCFVESGASIAWAGGYECFLHYSSVSRLEGCYAALTSRGGFMCLSDLDEPLRYIASEPSRIEEIHHWVKLASQ
jgi:hypothetical protein